MLVGQYSNVTIGKIYGISEAAIRKHIKKRAIVREKRIESTDISDEELNTVRTELLESINDSLIKASKVNGKFTNRHYFKPK